MPNWMSILGACATIYALYYYIRKTRQRAKLNKMIEIRLQEREDSIKMAEEAGGKVDFKLKARIWQWDFKTLRDELQLGNVSCLDVVRTFMLKAVQAHRKTNCVVLFVKEAEDWAREWDQKAKEPNFKKPPFFGIPISLKESISLGGYDLTRGFSQNLFQPTDVDCLLVQQLKQLGCIPYVQTNIPQSLLAYNSSNPIYGATSHPLDSRRTAGGSSGGEGAILAADGSLLGIGSDVGGSIRIPCHMTGTAGIKPSAMRISHYGVEMSVPGRVKVNANDGPMAREISTVVELLKELWRDTSASAIDPYLPPVVWNDEMYSSGKKYRIGYYLDDGWFTPHPSIQRGVLEAKQHLEAAGHTVVPFAVPKVPRAMRLFIRALSVDGGKYVLQKFAKDVVEPTLNSQLYIYMVPIWIQRLLAYPVSFFFPRLGNCLSAMTLTTAELRQTYAEIDDYRDEFVKMMADQKLDALLCPPLPMPAPAHTIPSQLFPACSYTAIFNMLDFGAGVVNVTKVTKYDELEAEDNYPESDLWYRILKRACKGSTGLHVGVQVAAPPYREEIVLRLLRDIEIGVTGK